MTTRARYLTGIGAALVALVACTPEAASEVEPPNTTPTETAPFPPLLIALDDVPHPAFEAASQWCNQLTIKHEWRMFADMTLSEDSSQLTLEQRDYAWIQDVFYQHDISTGYRVSSYDLTWIDDYLGHPPADGYFLWAGQTCVMAFLDAPPSILEDMFATRIEDGVQTATWGVYRATWTNDGANGPDVVFTYEQPAS